MKNLVSVEWLAEEFQASDMVILDSSTVSNAAGLIVPFPAIRISGAHVFDFKGRFSSQESTLPNMMSNRGCF